MSADSMDFHRKGSATLALLFTNQIAWAKSLVLQGQIHFYCLFFLPQNETAFEEAFNQANFQTFVFRSRVKMETYNVSGEGQALDMNMELVESSREREDRWKEKERDEENAISSSEHLLSV